MLKTGASTYAQEAIKQELEKRKTDHKKTTKQIKEATQQTKRTLASIKAKQKHRGH